MNAIAPGFIVILMLLCVLVLFLRKDKMIIPIIVAICFLPADIAIVVGGLNFQAGRLLSLVAFIKIYSDPNRTRFDLNTIDILFILYNILGAVIYIVASFNTVGAFIYKSGTLIDSVLLYLVFRHIIRSEESLRLIIKTFAICVVILLPFVVFEYFSAQNLFSFVGRSRISIRGDEIRAMATFSHSILLGSFGAAILPLFWAAYKDKMENKFILPLLCCVFFVIASSSSGPIVALACALFFIYFFRWKRHGTLLAWAMLISASIIHFVRESPIWHFLFVRVTIKPSSTGYHRYLLIEAAVKEFSEWWLLGYGDIGPQWHIKYWPRNHARFTDITNHYLLEGVRGGLFTMLIFICLCYKVIKALGSFAIAQKNVNQQWLWWAFAVMMITHCVTFLSVAYFGQIVILFYLTVAVASYALDENNRMQQQIGTQ